MDPYEIAWLQKMVACSADPIRRESARTRLELLTKGKDPFKGDPLPEVEWIDRVNDVKWSTTRDWSKCGRAMLLSAPAGTLHAMAIRAVAVLLDAASQMSRVHRAYWSFIW